MYAGQIVEQATRVPSCSHQPLHPYTQKLFAALPGAARRKASRWPRFPAACRRLAASSQGCRFAARCDKAWALCHEQAPDWTEIQTGDDAGQGVRCHLYSAVDAEVRTGKWGRPEG